VHFTIDLRLGSGFLPGARRIEYCVRRTDTGLEIRGDRHHAVGIGDKLLGEGGGRCLAESIATTAEDAIMSDLC
jgi:hypothetical protein